MRKTCLAIALVIGASGFLASAQTPIQASATVQQPLDEFEKQKYAHEQFYAAKAIVATKDVAVLPRLERWLTHEDRQLRGNAAFVFAALGDPKGLDAIVAILNDFSPRPATPNLGPYAGPGSFEALSRAQTRSDRRYAAWLLGQLKDPRGVAALVVLLTDRDVNVTIAWSLGQIGDGHAIQPLIRTLSGPDPELRVYAIHALAALKATDALPALRHLLSDNARWNGGSGESVAEAAQEAISKLQE